MAKMASWRWGCLPGSGLVDFVVSTHVRTTGREANGGLTGSGDLGIMMCIIFFLLCSLQVLVRKLRLAFLLRDQRNVAQYRFDQ